MIRLVFTADNHLSRYYAKMTPEQLAKRRQRLREAWAQTVDFAIQKHAHLYLHGGDLFDMPDPRTSELVWVARQFQRLREAGIETLAIGGNHDVPKMRTEGATPLRIYNEVRVAHVFTKSTEVEWRTFDFDGLRLAVGGLSPDPRLVAGDDPLADVIVQPPAADVVLLLMHYAVEGTIYYEANEPILSKASIAALPGVHYLLVGHVHQERDVLVGDVRCCFPGSTERMTFGELETRPGFLYVELEGRGPARLHQRPIEPQPMHRLVIRTTDLPPQDPTGFVFQKIQECSHPELLLQCRLEGPLSRELYHSLRFFEIWRQGNELNAFFDLDRSYTYLADEAPRGGGHPTLQRVSPREEIEKVATALLSEASAEERDLIEEARRLVLERYG
jgi:DNA repair exonuclease SbcCD nuclease subunit